jgi:hypothetical protein
MLLASGRPQEAEIRAGKHAENQRANICARLVQAIEEHRRREERGGWGIYITRPYLCACNCLSNALAAKYPPPLQIGTQMPWCVGQDLKRLLCRSRVLVTLPVVTCIASCMYLNIEYYT